MRNVVIVLLLVLVGGLFAGWLDPIPVPYDSFAPGSFAREVTAFKSTGGEPLFLFYDKSRGETLRDGRVILCELRDSAFYGLDTIYIPLRLSENLRLCLNKKIRPNPASDSLLLIFEENGVILFKWVFNNRFCGSDSLEYLSYLTPNDTTGIWPCVCGVVYSFDNDGSLWISYSTMDWYMSRYYLCTYRFDFPYIEPDFCDTQDVTYSPAYYFLDIYTGLSDTLISIYYGSRNFASDYQIDPCVISYLSSGVCVMTNFWDGCPTSHKKCQSLMRTGNSIVMAGRTDYPIVGANYWVSWKKLGHPWSNFTSTPVDSPWVCTQLYNGLAMLNEDTCFLAFRKFNNYAAIDSKLVHLGELPPEFDAIPYERPFTKGLQALGFYGSKLYIQLWNDSSETFIGIFDPMSPGMFERLERTPGAFSLSASPNPFNSSVRIEVEGEWDSPVQIEIYDVAGRKIQTLRPSATSLEKGGTDVPPLHKGGQGGSYIWQPHESLPSGVYLVRATVGEKTATRRVVYLK